MANDDSNLDGLRIIIGLTGGIACYKVAGLVSKLVQAGAIVDVLMTKAATRFIAPLTFASLTGRPVFDSQWTYVDGHGPQHIKLATSADVMLIAPCTMDMLGKLANGMTDDPVSLVTSAIDRSKTSVLLAPSMNETMLRQPSTIRNINTLREDGYIIIEPEDGWQACKHVGTGRLPESDALFEALNAVLG
jgi:phosphopantothenoylcysteine decarboxylase/phosphopantothenate--cysteine ligase